MTKTRAGLTELEGAILGVLRRGENLTAYAVRGVFRASRSAEWSGSTGAVYPAIARLRKVGLIKARATGDKRGSKAYELTAAGEAALGAWVCDVERAAGPGLDPFRVRAADLPWVPATARRAFLSSLRRELEKRCAELSEALPSMAAPDAVMAELHVALLETRLTWIKNSGHKI